MCRQAATFAITRHSSNRPPTHPGPFLTRSRSWAARQHEVAKTGLGAENRGGFPERAVPELTLEVRATEGRGCEVAQGELREAGCSSAGRGWGRPWAWDAGGAHVTVWTSLPVPGGPAGGFSRAARGLFRAAWEWMGGGGRRRAGQGTLLPPPRRGDRGLDPRSGHSGRWRGGGSGCLIRGSWHIRPFCHTPSLPKLPCTPGSHCKLLPCP